MILSATFATKHECAECCITLSVRLLLTSPTGVNTGGNFAHALNRKT